MTVGPGMDAGELRVRIVSDAGTLPKDVERKVNSAADQAVRGTRKAGRDIAASARDIGGKASLFMTAPLLLVAAKASEAASDTVESVNKTNVVFGQAAKGVLAFGDTSAKGFGISRRAALEAAGTFGNLFRAMGVGEQVAADTSVTMTKLAGDLASFNNASPEDVLIALRAGLLGEAEPLRKFGVQLSEARVQAVAVAEGLVRPVKDQAKIVAALHAVEAAQRNVAKATKEHGAGSLEASQAQDALVRAQRALETATKGSTPALTDQQKLLARQKIILQDTTLAQGDFQRSLSTSQANQQRVTAALADDAQAAFGKRILPLIQRGTILVGKLAGAFAGMGEGGQTAVLVTAGILASLGPVLKVGGNVARVYRALTSETAKRAVETIKLNAAVAKLIIKEKLAQAVTIARTLAEKAAAAVTKAWAAVQVVFNAVLTANPIFFVIAGLVALGIALFVAYKKSETFRNIVNAAFHAIATTVGAVLTIVRTVLSVLVALAITSARLFLDPFIAAGKLLYSIFATIIPPIFEAFRAYVSFVFNAIRAYIDLWVRVFRAVLVGGFNAARAVLAPVINAIRSLIVGTFQAAKAVIGPIVNGIKTVVLTVFNTIKGALDKIGGGIKGAIVGAFDAMKTPILGVARFIRGVLNSIIRAINKVKIKVPKVDLPFGGTVGGQQFGFDIPEIPAFAEGARVKGGRGGLLALVGEGRYDELITPLDGEHGTGPTIITNVYNPVGEPTEESVSKRLRRLSVMGAWA